MPTSRRIAPFLSFVVVLTCAVAAWGPLAQDAVPGRSRAAACRAAKRNAHGRAAIHARPGHARGELRERCRARRRRTPRACRQSRSNRACPTDPCFPGARCPARALRRELAGCAQPPRFLAADGGGKVRSGEALSHDRRQHRAIGRRCENPRTGAGRGAVRTDDRAAGGSAHPRRGHECAAGRRGNYRGDEGDRPVDGRAPAGQCGPGSPRRDRGRTAARDHRRVVHVLQRLRPALHLVDGGSICEGRRGAEGLRVAAA